MNLADLRCVEWVLEGGDEPRRELTPVDDVEHLCRAVLALHHEPGVNPHSGRAAAKLLRLSVGTPRLHEGYWWTAPSLDETVGPRARVVSWGWERRFEAAPLESDPPDPV